MCPAVTLGLGALKPLDACQRGKFLAVRGDKVGGAALHGGTSSLRALGTQPSAPSIPARLQALAH